MLVQQEQLASRFPELLGPGEKWVWAERTCFSATHRDGDSGAMSVLAFKQKQCGRPLSGCKVFTQRYKIRCKQVSSHTTKRAVLFLSFWERPDQPWRPAGSWLLPSLLESHSGSWEGAVRMPTLPGTLLSPPPGVRWHHPFPTHHQRGNRGPEGFGDLPEARGCAESELDT